MQCLQVHCLVSPPSAQFGINFDPPFKKLGKAQQPVKGRTEGVLVESWLQARAHLFLTPASSKISGTKAGLKLSPPLPLTFNRLWRAAKFSAVSAAIFPESRDRRWRGSVSRGLDSPRGLPGAVVLRGGGSCWGCAALGWGGVEKGSKAGWLSPGTLGP